MPYYLTAKSSPRVFLEKQKGPRNRGSFTQSLKNTHDIADGSTLSQRDRKKVLHRC